MLTSKKLLIGTAALLFILLLAGIVALRAHFRTMIARDTRVVRYEEVSTESFESLEISSGWSVIVSQERDVKLEIGNNAGLNFTIKNQNGMLQLMTDSLANQEKIHARITMPLIRILRISGNSDFLLGSFVSSTDTMRIVLADSVVFRSLGNKYKKVSIETSGNPRIDLLKDPME